MSLFELPPPFVLREAGAERSAVAVCEFTNANGEKVLYVRAGQQWRAESGEWRWKRDAGVSIPLRKLGELARWLIDAARAIPRPESTAPKGWADQ